jgi:cell division protein FtsN
MKKSLVVAVLAMFVALGLGTAVIAQQTDSSSSAQSQSQQPSNPSDPSSSSSSSSSATAPKTDESTPAAPAPSAQDRPSSSSSTSVEIKGDRAPAGSGDVAASPRTGESRRIFGLDPTAAVLIAAAILVVVVLALVAMSRGAAETSSHTDIDLDRRR